MDCFYIGVAYVNLIHVVQSNIEHKNMILRFYRDSQCQSQNVYVTIKTKLCHDRNKIELMLNLCFII